MKNSMHIGARRIKAACRGVADQQGRLESSSPDSGTEEEVQLPSQSCTLITTATDINIYMNQKIGLVSTIILFADFLLGLPTKSSFQTTPHDFHPACTISAV